MQHLTFQIFNRTFESRTTKVIYLWQKYLCQKPLNLLGKVSRRFIGIYDTGKLSSSQNDNGSKSIDVSELQRVYGNLKLKNEIFPTHSND